jgi:hypothetical protein
MKNSPSGGEFDLLKYREKHSTGVRGEISDVSLSSILRAKKPGACPKDFWTDFKEG